MRLRFPGDISAGPCHRETGVTAPGGTETARLTTYLPADAFVTAKSAYLADLDGRSGAPAGFARWIDQAIADHAGLSPQQRSAAAERSGGAANRSGAPRSFLVGAATVAAMEAAITTDRRSTGRLVSRSGFIADAIHGATARARTRYGRDLPPAPSRLPNRPPRAGRA